jgi:hypothetical protein
MALQSSRVSGQVEVPKDVVERVRTLRLALPEVTVRVDESRTKTRSTAQSFDIRGRSFCLLVAKEGPTGHSIPLLVLRADPDERDLLLSIGDPFFTPRVSRGRIGVLLTKDVDWEEIGELVTESYRVIAPKKLTTLLDSHAKRPTPGLETRLDRTTVAHVGLSGCGRRDEGFCGIPRASLADARGQLVVAWTAMNGTCSTGSHRS